MKTKEKVEVELNDGKLVKTGPGRFEATSEDMEIRGIQITTEKITVSKIRKWVGANTKTFGIYVEVEPKKVAGEISKSLQRNGVNIAVAELNVTFDPEDLKVIGVGTSRNANSAHLKNKKRIEILGEAEIQGRKYPKMLEFDFGEERRDLAKLLGKKAIKDEYTEIVGHEPKIHFWQRAHI